MKNTIQEKEKDEGKKDNGKGGRKEGKYFIVFMQSFGLADLLSTGPTPKCLALKLKYRTCTDFRSVSHFTSSSLISLPLPLKRLTKITCL